MDTEKIVTAVAIMEIAGNDYTSFMKWVYERLKIEEICNKCQKECPYLDITNTIEDYVECAIGPVNYAELYKEFKKLKESNSSPNHISSQT